MAYPLRVRQSYSQPGLDALDGIDHDSHNEDKPEFDADDLALLQEAKQNPNKILTSRPVPLGYVSVACIIINRMIGKAVTNMTGNSANQQHFRNRHIQNAYHCNARDRECWYLDPLLAHRRHR
jgi:hypothetical protein